jgi:site-specific DNA-cytosine methylase
VQDIFEEDVANDNLITEKGILYMNRNFGKVNRWNKGYHSHSQDVSRCLTADYHKGVPYNVCIVADVSFKVDHVKDGHVVLTKDGKEIQTVIRRFTPRECARLQGYPDDFKLHPTATQAYKQIGNSVTAHVVQKLMEIVQSKLIEGEVPGKGN